MCKKLYLILLLLASLNLQAQNEELLFSPEGIAEIHITLADGKEIGDIKNEKVHADYAGKVKGSMIITNSSTSTYTNENFYTGNILIDGRGNTSWHHDKRPYNIDLVGEDWETEQKAPLLGMPEGEEWCLLAFWMDRSLMRFQIASYLGQYMTGISWVPRNRYVEVWINNDYRGLYALTEKIQRDDNRVDIKKLEAASTNLSGGYLLEGSTPDKLKPEEQEVEFRTAQDDINFTFKYPKPKNVTYAQRTWIKNYLDEFETVLRGSGYNDPVNGYLKYINENSFIDWTILYELSKGCDNLFHASIFVHKDRDDKLNMSSPWDFDLSYGNSGIYAEEGAWVRMHRWFGKLYQDPVYAQKFNTRFIELLPLLNSVPEIIRTNYDQLEMSGVLEREYAKYPAIINDFVSDGEGRRTPTSYNGHAQFLSEWMMSRKNWVYTDLGLDNTEKGHRMREIKPVIRVMAPENKENKQSFGVKVMRSQDSGTNKYTYSWNNGSFGATWNRTISQTGKYWVKIKDEWGNISLASDTLYFGVKVPTSIDNPTAEMVLTYTNPATELITINYSSPVSNSKLSVSLWDMRGVKMFETGFNTTTGYNQIQMPVAELQRGMYIMRLQANNASVSKKIILK
ncbi:MAG: CotH kinase family protein [Paludibacter sp.]